MSQKLKLNDRDVLRKELPRAQRAVSQSTRPRKRSAHQALLPSRSKTAAAATLATLVVVPSFPASFTSFCVAFILFAPHHHHRVPPSLVDLHP